MHDAILGLMPNQLMIISTIACQIHMIIVLLVNYTALQISTHVHIIAIVLNGIWGYYWRQYSTTK